LLAKETRVNTILTVELEKLVRESVERGDYENPDARVQEAVTRLLQENEAGLRQAIEEGIDDLERGNYVDYDERTIADLANDVHQRGLKRLAERQKTGTRG
jgi:Arc/MetJ-type ribon-helix-helix transcriptional regulator